MLGINYNVSPVACNLSMNYDGSQYYFLPTNNSYPFLLFNESFCPVFQELGKVLVSHGIPRSWSNMFTFGPCKDMSEYSLASCLFNAEKTQ